MITIMLPQLIGETQAADIYLYQKQIVLITNSNLQTQQLADRGLIS